MNSKEMILVVNVGNPYNQLLTRSIRQFGVYSELHNHTISVERVKELRPKGIIFSGGSYRGIDGKIDPEIFELGIPILGIAYGMHVIASHFGKKANVEDNLPDGNVSISMEREAACLKTHRNSKRCGWKIASRLLIYRHLFLLIQNVVIRKSYHSVMRRRSCSEYCFILKKRKQNMGVNYCNNF